MSRLHVVASVLTTVAGGMPLFLLGALAVQVSADLGISRGSLGVVYATFFVATGLGLVLVSGFVDRMGWRRTARVGAAIVMVALAVIVGVANGFVVLALAYLIAGIGQALAIPAGNIGLISGVPVSHRALTFGLKQSAIPFVSLLAGLSVPAVVGWLDWRVVFIVASIVPLAVLVTVRPGTGRGVPPGDRPVLVVPIARAATWTSGRRYLGWPLVTLTLAGTLGGFCVSSLNGFVLLSAVDTGIPEARAGIYLAIGSFFTVLVRIGGGWVVGRVGSDGIRPMAFLMLAGATGLGLLASGRIELVLPGMLLAYGPGWGWNGLFQHVVAHMHPASPGHATSIAYAGVVLGGIPGALSTGALADAFGFGVSWSICVAGLVMAAFLVGVILPFAIGRVTRSAASPLDDG